MRRSMFTLTMIVFAGVGVFLCGCNIEKQGERRLTMAEGSLSVKNMADVDIFPVVQTKNSEDFGGVSTGAFKTIGFASIDVDNTARVTWAEKEWNASKQTVVFFLKTSPRVIEKTKHIEFCYKGKGSWELNLYDSSPPQKEPLTSIHGQTE